MLLAQANIGRLKKPLDHPDTKEFKDGLEGMYALAESSPGFVWRVQSNYDTDEPRPYDRSILITLSVWESVDSLKGFVYKSHHAHFVSRRKNWFEPLDGPHLVLWWIPKDTMPTIWDVKERLDHLANNGVTEFAFTFQHQFPQPNLSPLD